MTKRNEIDIQIIGSDKSLKAVEASTNNIEYADIQSLCEHGLVKARNHRYINTPLIYSQHWPKPFRKTNDIENTTAKSVVNLQDPERPLLMSLYQGDF